ncbi:unnamed protein product [Dovyalis caffra]|uniref:Uncharacterized protein n=1 Tax=Dovyalis caffra TaxID=77055 RepID=A0AAV1SDE2_9ROSI|nr:unnamed protein product [Dovyalis caffra]
MAMKIQSFNLLVLEGSPCHERELYLLEVRRVVKEVPAGGIGIVGYGSVVIVSIVGERVGNFCKYRDRCGVEILVKDDSLCEEVIGVSLYGDGESDVVESIRFGNEEWQRSDF